MIKLDIFYFGRLDDSGCANRGIDHCNTLARSDEARRPSSLIVQIVPPPLISTRGSKPSPKPSLLRSLRLSGASRQLRERLLLFQPRLIFFLLVDDDLATHVCVRATAELGAEDLEGPGSGGDEPDIADHARHHIHLGPELRHIEAVHDVD